MNQITVRVRKHSWLDMSVSWYIDVNRHSTGGEYTSEAEAIQDAKDLAKDIGAIYDPTIHETNELFS